MTHFEANPIKKRPALCDPEITLPLLPPQHDMLKMNTRTSVCSSGKRREFLHGPLFGPRRPCLASSVSKVSLAVVEMPPHRTRRAAGRTRVRVRSRLRAQQRRTGGRYCAAVSAQPAHDFLFCVWALSVPSPFLACSHRSSPSFCSPHCSGP